jgi:hypothetical protein
MYYFISLALSFVFTYKWFKIMYPAQLRIIINKLEEVTYKVGWYSLKIYTIGQRAVKETKKCVKKYILPLIKLEEDNLFFLLAGGITFKTNHKELLRSDMPYYDLIIYIIDSPTYDEKYMIICNQIQHINNNVEKSNVKLLSPQIKLNGNLIPLVFENNENIYLTNNILFDKIFISWYLSTTQDIQLKDTDNYSIHFIDHNMEFVELMKDKKIVLDKDDYRIIEN